MSFPTVKSDPYKQGKKRLPCDRLWPPEFWKRLVRKAEAETSAWQAMNREIPEPCLDMIREMNLTLYGRA